MSAAGQPGLLLLSEGVRALAQGLNERYAVAVLDEHDDHDAFLRREGARFTAALALGDEPYDARRMALLPNLALISVLGAGMDAIDLDAAKQRGIAVTNAGNLNAGDVADYAVAMMLAQWRDVIGHDRHVRSGRWSSEGRAAMLPTVRVQNVGIVGLGHIGMGIARRLEPFDCTIRWWGPRTKPDAPWPRMESLVGLADWSTTLVVAAAGNDDTRGLVGADTIAALGAEGLLVNVSRGYVVDEDALLRALREGRLGGAALDVFAEEPDDGSAWTDVPGTLLAPHVAGATQEAWQAVVRDAVDNLRRLLDAEPLLHRVV